MLLIGSRALSFYLSNFREPKDWDVIAEVDEVCEWVDNNKAIIDKYMFTNNDTKLIILLKDETQIEMELALSGSSAEAFYRLSSTLETDFYGTKVRVASPNTLYLIKKSHLYD